MANISIPNNLQLLYTEDQIAAVIREMGAAVGKWADELWEDSHSDILSIPILRGAMFFFADLVREIPRSVEIAPARTWAYEDNRNLRSEIQINLDQIPAKGRSVLLVDDICDSGRTLCAIHQALLDAGARQVKSAVLVQREIDKEIYKPEWVGFKYSGNEWMVGFGMDDNDRFRNLPAIYLIKQS